MDALSFSTLSRKQPYFLHQEGTICSTVIGKKRRPYFLHQEGTICSTVIVSPKPRDLDFLLGEVEVLDSSKPANQKKQLPSKTNEPSDDSQPSERMESTVQISHPWPEWVDLMELLLRRGYFEADGNPVGNKELGSKDVGCIRTACLNFARDRSGLIRYFSRKDIGVIAGCGCPSIDRKVVNSGKRFKSTCGHQRRTCLQLLQLKGGL
ncbi:RAN BP2/NZF ZINC FINGER-LIKE SUPERFAMILY PROTEIN [Salix viminalis]|uniref:RAN BP2/NZF ZINC FINGER-LIKE SUPERFAMILY PROTEIN n=1 Tax=Salix viminalis TaxID=40686 RepID=A0A9Q0U0S7_SALVM|nr:RAN BP2/NZF ZINC FINGER-LIKE SUPERFAMILY PROTEIN [Salix viminalis]